MSLQTIVGSGLAGVGSGLTGRRHLRPAAAEPSVASGASGATIERRPTGVAMGLPGSMRVLETGLALTALATAFLVGLGR